jgi:hypothetical protein
MNKLIFSAAALAALVLSACETPTVYAPQAGPQASGYSEMAIEHDRWRITFNGGSHANARRVDDLALLRASDVTLAQGYDWFRVVERRAEMRPSGGPVMSLGVGGADFGRRSAVGVSGETGFDLGGGPRVSETLEILMGRGAAPKEPDVYDARDVRRTIAPRV